MSNISKTKYIFILILICTLLGCAGAPQTQVLPKGGILISTEVSPQETEPGGAVSVTLLVNNYYNHTLKDVSAQLLRNHGEIEGDEEVLTDIGDIPPDPNYTAVFTWDLSVSSQASGLYSNRAKICFAYTQNASHNIIITKTYKKEVSPSGREDTGPLQITFSGIDRGIYYSGTSRFSMKVQVTNGYVGYVGNLSTSSGDVRKYIKKVRVEIHDSNTFDSDWPFFNITKFPDELEFRGYDDDIKSWVFENPDDEPIEVIADKLSLGFLISLPPKPGTEDAMYTMEDFFPEGMPEELTENVRVSITYGYCIESNEFNFTVVQPEYI